eukprot:TRINITY_DN2846_c1_g1_i5.p3 TRINITY_DN2846_c1_g1~~TRINITY_DN2846_c1_g1_i5.p3  ORF type:complete len:256 (+),score=-13.10 TRINITY_DN2846_c1_g1_i5:412-1179(+)
MQKCTPKLQTVKDRSQKSSSQLIRTWPLLTISNEHITEEPLQSARKITFHITLHVIVTDKALKIIKKKSHKRPREKRRILISTNALLILKQPTLEYVCQKIVRMKPLTTYHNLDETSLFISQCLKNMQRKLPQQQHLNVTTQFLPTDTRPLGQVKLRYLQPPPRRNSQVGELQYFQLNLTKKRKEKKHRQLYRKKPEHKTKYILNSIRLIKTMLNQQQQICQQRGAKICSREKQQTDIRTIVATDERHASKKEYS